MSDDDGNMIHPWDIDTIDKGHTLSVHDLERLTGHRYGTTQYRFAVLALRQRLIRELRDVGRPACVAFVKEQLRVLTDTEAVAYTRENSDRGVRKVAQSHQQMLFVDAANLSEADAATHTRNLIVSGVRAAALRGARAAIQRRFSAGSSKELEPAADAAGRTEG